MNAAALDLPISLCRIDPALAALVLTGRGLEEAHAALRAPLPEDARRLADHVLVREVQRGILPAAWLLREHGLPPERLPAPPPGPSIHEPLHPSLLARRRRFVRAFVRALRRSGRDALASLLEQTSAAGDGRTWTTVPILVTFRDDGTGARHPWFAGGAVIALDLRRDAGSVGVVAGENIPEDRRPLVEFAVDLLGRQAVEGISGASAASGLRVEAGAGADHPGEGSARWQIDDPASAALPLLLSEHLLARRGAAAPRGLLASGAIVDGRLAPIGDVEAKVDVARRAGAQVLLLPEESVRQAALALCVATGSWRPGRRAPALVHARVRGLDLVGLPSVEPHALRPILTSIVDALFPDLTRSRRIARLLGAALAGSVIVYLLLAVWFPHQLRAWTEAEKSRLYDWVREPKGPPDPGPWYLRLFLDQRLSLASAYNRRGSDLMHEAAGYTGEEQRRFLRAATDHALIALKIGRQLERERSPGGITIPVHVLFRRLFWSERTILSSNLLGQDEALALMAERRARLQRFLAASPGGDREQRLQYATACCSDGIHVITYGMHDLGRARLAEAERLFDALEAEEPLDVEAATDSAASSYHLYRLETLANRLDATLAPCERAARILGKIWTEPEKISLTARANLAGLLAEVELHLGRLQAGPRPQHVARAAGLQLRHLYQRDGTLAWADWIPGTPIALRFHAPTSSGGWSVVIVGRAGRERRFPIGGPWVMVAPDADLESIATLEFRVIHPDGAEETLRRCECEYETR